MKVMQSTKAWGVVVAVLAATSAFAQSASNSAFGPGEQSTYKVEYLGMVAGTATITVGAETTQWGKPVLPIVTMAKSESVLDFYPIRDKFISYWDHRGERCLGSDLYADENRVKRHQRIKFDHGGKKATVIEKRAGADEKTWSRDVEPGAFDIASATFALRNKNLVIGESFELPVFTGRRSFTLKATVESRQTLDTVLGQKDVFKVRVQTGFSGKFQSKRDLYAYFTADEDRIPVRIEAEFVLGTVKAELSDYKSGRRYAMRADGGTPIEGSGGG